MKITRILTLGAVLCSQAVSLLGSPIESVDHNLPRLTSLTTRAFAGKGAQTMAVGFTIPAGPDKPVLIRVIGPGLERLKVGGALLDPKLTLYRSDNSIVTEKTGWNSADAERIGAVKAFALTPGSNDTVAFVTLSPGAYTAQVSSVGGNVGVAMVEVYETDTVTRLTNLSTRAIVTTSERTMAPTFVVSSGQGKRRLLIRALGPTLKALGVSGALNDPVITVTDAAGGSVRNDNWSTPVGAQASGPQAVAEAARTSGAFPLAEEPSKDAAILAEFGPGVYTVTVTDRNNASGAALLEIYDATIPKSGIAGGGPEAESVIADLLLPSGTTLINDDAASLSAASWTLQYNPRSGNYINDFANTLGNPSSIVMKPMLPGQYLLYSKDASMYNYLAKSVTIGSGRWYFEVRARIVDLMTPSADKAWEGLSFDVFANGKRYRVAFNTKVNGPDGSLDVVVMKNSSGTSYDSTTIKMPFDYADLHTWGVEYDGGTTLSITLDQKLVARSTGVNVSTAAADGVDIYNTTGALASGTNEVYLYSYKLVKGDPLPYSEDLIADDATLFSTAGWTASAPVTGQYIIDNTHSQGNPNSVTLRNVAKGSYLLYADGTASTSTAATLSKTFTIGAGSWTLDFKARVLDLMKPSANKASRGLVFEVYADGKKFQVAFNDKNKAVVSKDSSSVGYAEVPFPVPTDNQFHHWYICYDSDQKLYLGLDSQRVAEFEGVTMATGTSDRVVITNSIQDRQSGTTEVFLDEIRFTKNFLPAWAEIRSDPYSAEGATNLVTDFGERFIDNGWVLSTAPVSGNYIRDFLVTLGNPNGVSMLSVPQDEYLFYASSASTQSKVTKDMTIGPGPWYAEFDARFVNLMTYSANPGFNGFTVDVVANGRRVKVAFNSKDGSGHIKVSVVKNTVGAGVTDTKQITLPSYAGYLKWGIGFDGDNTVTVMLQGEVVSRVSGVTATETGDKVYLSNICYDYASGTNEVYLHSFKLENKVVPEWVTSAVTDNATSLSAAGWTRSNPPRVGNYITDNGNSLGNPNSVSMTSVPAGQYLFYSATNALYSSISQSVTVGSGPRYAQFDARIDDLPTPSANIAWAGFACDVFAGGKRYRVAFNSKDGSGNIKIYVLKSGSSYGVETVALPASGGFHRWGIGFDGGSTITVDLDGARVATFTGVSRTDGTADSMVLYADTYDLQSGTTKVVVDGIKLLRNYQPGIPPTETSLLNENATSLSSGGWSVSNSPATGLYITDHATTLGNPNGVMLKSVPTGQFLVYSDSTAAAGTYDTLTKSLTIPSGAWTLQLDAKILSLAKTSLKSDYSSAGLVIQVFSAGQRYVVGLSGYDAAKGTFHAYVFNTNSTYVDREITLPTDGLMHKWEIVYDGNGNLFLGVDDIQMAMASGHDWTDSGGDKIYIVNASKFSTMTGTNETYIDNVVLTQDKIPAWTKTLPAIAGVVIKPESSSSTIPVLVNVAGADPSWFSNANVTVKATLMNGSTVVASSSHALDAPYQALSVNGSSQTGVRQIKVELINNGIVVDHVTREIELFTSVSTASPNASLTASAGAVWLFTQVDQMKNASNQTAASAGWTVASYAYKGADVTNSGNLYNLIDAGPSAQTLKLPVTLNGWFGVYVGYVVGTQEFDVTDGTTQKKFSLEEVDVGHAYSEQTISEEFVIAKNFSGMTFSVIPVSGKRARIAYIKLRGLSSGDQTAYNAADEGALGKRVVINNDGDSDFFSLKYSSVDALKKYAVDLNAGKDVGSIDWCLLNTMQFNYESAYAGSPFDTFTANSPGMLEGDLYTKTMILNIHNNGGKWAPEVVAQRAYDNGLGCTVSLRMNNFYPEADYSHLNGKIYANFKGPPSGNECRQIDINGNRSVRMSFNYSRYRDYLKNVLVEAAAFAHVDGVNLDFCRKPDLFDTEQSNPATRISIMNQFMADVRAALPSGTKISARIPYDNYAARGYDPQTWLTNNYIDTLIPSVSETEDFFDVAPFVSMLSGLTGKKVLVCITHNLAGHDLTREEEAILRNGGTVDSGTKNVTRLQYQKRAYDAYQAGADGLYIFNNWINSRGILGLLGDKEKIKKWYYFNYYTEQVANPIFIVAP